MEKAGNRTGENWFSSMPGFEGLMVHGGVAMLALRWPRGEGRTGV